MRNPTALSVCSVAQILVAVVIGVLSAGCVGVAAGGAVTSALVVNDPRTAGTFIEDQTIEVKAYAELRKVQTIKKQTNVGVISYNQVVLLTGEAPEETLRQQVVDIVAAIQKVRHVHNEITLAAPRSIMSRTNDGLLTTKVKTKLLTNDEIDGTKIKVVSAAGTVYLLGLVPQSQGDNAAELTSKVGGVQRVVKLFEYQPEVAATTAAY